MTMMEYTSQACTNRIKFALALAGLDAAYLVDLLHKLRYAGSVVEALIRVHLPVCVSISSNLPKENTKLNYVKEFLKTQYCRDGSNIEVASAPGSRCNKYRAQDGL